MSDDIPDITGYEDYYHWDEGEDDYAPCDSSDVTDFGKVFLPTLYSLVFITGFVGNGLVVCVLVKYRKQANLMDICLFNLALSDLLFVLTLPFYSHYVVVSQWTFRDFMCHFLSGCHTIGFFSSIFFMVVMAMDRYLVIMHTCKVVRYRTLRTGIALSVLVWMLSLTVSLPAFIFSKVSNGSQDLDCSYRPENHDWKLYNLVSTNILGLMIPLLVMVICYSRIIPILVNMKSTKRHRVVKVIIVVVVTFFLFWAPYNICLLWRFLKFGEECKQDTNIRMCITVTETIAYIHCCLNPIIYAFVGQRFMKRALQLLRKWLPGLHLLPTRNLSDSSYRKSSIMSRSSDVHSTIIN